MREIKFRVWSENLQKMSKPFGLHANVVDFTDENGLGSIKSLSSEVIMQYTGIKDCDGNEIYEGDMCSIIDGYGVWHNCIVRFNTSRLCFELAYLELNMNPRFGDLADYIEDLKIIGNVHENKGE